MQISKPLHYLIRAFCCFSFLLAPAIFFLQTAPALTHQVALYLLDYDAALGGRSQRVDIFDQNGALLDSRSVSAFTNGQYLVWNVSGHVVAQIANTGSSSNNAVASGLFFR